MRKVQRRIRNEEKPPRNMSWEEFNKRIDLWCKKRGINPPTPQELQAARQAERAIRAKRAEEKLPK